MKTDMTEVKVNEDVVSGPKYCGDISLPTTFVPTTPQLNGEMTVIVMSYNLYGWNALVKHSWKAENVYEAIRRVNPDILGAQECEGREHDVAANIGNDYAVAGAASAGHSIIYRTSVLTFEDSGNTQLNEMDQWGPVGILSYTYNLVLTLLFRGQ